MQSDVDQRMSETKNHILYLVMKDMYATIEDCLDKPQAYDAFECVGTLHRLQVENIMLRIKAFVSVGCTLSLDLSDFPRVHGKSHHVLFCLFSNQYIGLNTIVQLFVRRKPDGRDEFNLDLLFKARVKGKGETGERTFSIKADQDDSPDDTMGEFVIPKVIMGKGLVSILGKWSLLNCD